MTDRSFSDVSLATLYDALNPWGPSDDFYLDLLFYNRKLRRLVAVELKVGEFKVAYKGQMELYLRWLEKYEREPEEASPLGIILLGPACRALRELRAGRSRRR